MELSTSDRFAIRGIITGSATPDAAEFRVVKKAFGPAALVLSTQADVPTGNTCHCCSTLLLSDVENEMSPIIPLN